VKKAGKVAGKVASGAGAAATVGSLFIPQGNQQPQQRSFDDFEYVEARDPRFSVSDLKKAGRIAGKVTSGVGAAATVGSLLVPQSQVQQRRSLESREPRITSAQAKSFVKGAAKVGGYAQSGVELGAAVAPLFPHKSRRSFNDLETRKFRMPSHSTMRAIGGAAVGAAGFGGTIAAMNTQPQQRRELETREPRITSAEVKSFVRGAAKVGGYAQNGIELGASVAPLLPHKNRRSLEDLETRTFRMPSHSSMRAIGGAVVGAAGFGGTIAALNTKPQQRRELEAREPEYFPLQRKTPARFTRQETLEVRDPNFFSTIAKDVGKVAKLVIREDELEAREPNFFSSIEKDVGKVAKLVIREDELEAREPEPNFFSTIAKDVGKVAKLVIREDENGELYVRDLSDEYYLD